MLPYYNDLTAVVLAGGQARRMGGSDKGLLLLNGRPLISYTLDALQPCTARILINANRNHQAYRQFGLPVIADDSGNYEGPLAGILSVLRQATTPYLLCVPCDSPQIRPPMLHRLVEALRDDATECSVAHDGQRLHPVFLALKCSLAASLQAYLESGDRKIDLWLQQHRCRVVDYSDCPQMFINVNTPAQLRELESAPHHES